MQQECLWPQLQPTQGIFILPLCLLSSLSFFECLPGERDFHTEKWASEIFRGDRGCCIITVQGEERTLTAAVQSNTRGSVRAPVPRAVVESFAKRETCALALPLPRTRTKRERSEASPIRPPSHGTGTVGRDPRSQDTRPHARGDGDRSSPSRARYHPRGGGGNRSPPSPGQGPGPGGARSSCFRCSPPCGGPVTVATAGRCRGQRRQTGA